MVFDVNEESQGKNFKNSFQDKNSSENLMRWRGVSVLNKTLFSRGGR